MNISLVMTAVQHGAIVANHTEVTAIYKSPDASRGGEPRICGARLKDNMTGEEWDVKCRVSLLIAQISVSTDLQGIINATGPFSDGVRKLDEPTVQEIVAPSAGVHITLPNYYGPKTMGLLDPATSDGRVIFFLPWQGNVIAGTTDSPTTVSQNPIPPERRSSGSWTRCATTSRRTLRSEEETFCRRGLVYDLWSRTPEQRTPRVWCGIT